MESPLLGCSSHQGLEIQQPGLGNSRSRSDQFVLVSGRANTRPRGHARILIMVGGWFCKTATKVAVLGHADLPWAKAVSCRLGSWRVQWNLPDVGLAADWFSYWHHALFRLPMRIARHAVINSWDLGKEGAAEMVALAVWSALSVVRGAWTSS